MKSFFEDLNAPYALIFGGQGSAWAPQLSALLHSSSIAKEVGASWQKAKEKVSPLALQIATAAPSALDRLEALFEGEGVSADKKYIDAPPLRYPASP